MLATLVDKPFDAEGWIYEIKWDGYRALAYLTKGTVTLSSRNNKSFDEKFYAVRNALQQLKLEAVLDGEIVVVNDKGLADFGKLQNWRSEADGMLLFYVFDILWVDGRSLLELPLVERRSILENILPKDNDSILLSQAFDAKGTTFFKTAENMKLEGIMAKKADSLYLPGARSKEWLKIKTQTRQEVVIGGYTLNEGSSKTFSSLLVGVFKKNKLIYTGKIGTGFSEKLQQEMMAQFKPLITDQVPFSEEPDVNKPSRFRPNPPKAKAVWLKPNLVCEVSYRELTSEGIMRHPSFEGMRIDKPSRKVILEKEEDTAKIVKKQTGKKNLIKPPKKGERKTFLNPKEEAQVRPVDGHDIKFGNLSKIYWPKDKISKRDMLNYYYQVAEYIIPYLKDRPQSLNRFPNGINGPSFYQKDVTGKVPDWIPKFPYTSEGQQKNFMLCNDEASLLYMASLGCIEFNPWSSTIQKPDNPDWCMIDLDPDKNSFNQVIETANVTRDVLSAAGIDCYCKTSGSTGLHIYIPLGKKYSYEESKEFARIIATLVHEQTSKFTSIERMIKNRGGKMYIDFLQNRPSATLASAYSLRPKPEATVSMPLHWEEVKKGLKMKDYNIHNAIAKIREQGDIFKPVLGKGINMAAALKKLLG
ncbi:MAG: DNA ligase D [Chitinophagaceae bacterium]|nr:MAG: DNA ligase D [Chitinophagaceae bacterium]